jgi:signal transduction histidine kinase
MRSDEPSTGSVGSVVAGDRVARCASNPPSAIVDGGHHISAPKGTPGHRHVNDVADAVAILELQERERVRIGFDLHDGPAQTMSAALLQVRMLQDLTGPDLEAGLNELRATISAGLEEIYELIETLGARGSGGDDLVSRIRSCVDTFSSRSDIPISIEMSGDAGEVSPSLQIAAARIVQEALSNVGRHSAAAHVAIRLDLTPDVISCRIADDGTGFDLREALTAQRNREPWGLHSMTERARLLDGECVIESSPGAGTVVRFAIPVWRG